jgi:hypothetical protein
MTVSGIGASSGGGVATAARTAQQEKVAPRSASGAQMMPAPAARVLPKAVHKKEAVRAAYLFEKERLQKTIARQAQEVQQVLDDQGLEPEDVTFGYVIDLTGEDAVVCVACGRPSCDYRPTSYRGPNPEVDLMADSITVFQEAVSKTGANYFFLLYDDKQVTVLREPAGPANDTERAGIVQRFREFRDAQKNMTVTPQWMSEMMTRWTPDMTTRKFVDAPQDEQAADVAIKLFAHLETCVHGVFWAKSIAKGNMGEVENSLRKNGIIASGMAMGSRADAVAGMMFEGRTIKARDMHDTADLVGTGLANIIELVET